MVCIRTALFLATLSIALSAPVGTSIAKAEGITDQERPHAPARLQVHAVPVDSEQGLLDRLSQFVPRQRMMYFAQRHELVVYADAKTQGLIASKIEQDALVQMNAAAANASGDQPSLAASPPPIQGNATRAQTQRLKSLPLPRGNVRIVYLKELDLILIRAAR